MARWFGLNQSKYQWALDDYYENKGLVSLIELIIVISLCCDVLFNYILIYEQCQLAIFLVVCIFNVLLISLGFVCWGAGVCMILSSTSFSCFNTVFKFGG